MRKGEVRAAKEVEPVLDKECSLGGGVANVGGGVANVAVPGGLAGDGGR